MQVSEKRINFADVIELGRHIEILLLSNDCVIVPGFGGFMAHHVEARYDDRDELFLPPLRTLGFNPMLTINDSLLVQSYVEAYDISYPEALSRIEEEVKALEREIRETGFYEINNIGVISLNEEGHYLFSPCEAGILTPQLYGLYSFSFPTRASKNETAEIAPAVSHIVPSEQMTNGKVADTMPELINVANDNVDDDNNESNDEDHDDKVITIKLSWIRNVAVAAAVIIATFFITSPVANSNQDMVSTQQLQQSMMAGVVSTALIAQKDSPNIDDSMKALAKAEAIKKAEADKAARIATETIKKAEAEKKAEAIKKAEAEKITEAIKKAEAETKKKTADKNEQGKYCIVLASHVAKKNANAYASQLQADGYKDSYIYTHNGIVRVVYGHFDNENQAFNQLRHLRKEKSDFGQAWVYKQR